MSRLRFSQVPNTAVLTPPTGKATVFLDSVDNVIKAKLDDGSLIILTVTQEYIEDLVADVFQDSITIDFTYDDVNNRITGEVIQSALNTSLIPNVPSGTISATNTQAAINELDLEKVPNTRQVNAGAGLVGGGDLTVDRTISMPDVGIPGTYFAANSTPSITTDQQGRVTSIVLNLISITSAQVTDFNEAAQDAVGNILTDSTSVDFTYSDVANTITASVIPGGVDHNALLNYVANQHVDHSTVNINAGTGLNGGGDITVSRTLNIADTGVTASTYGTATQVSTFTVNAQGQLTAASNTTIAIPSTQVIDFTEAAQDSVGNILTDTATIDLTYNDALNQITADVKDGSIVDAKIAPGINATKISTGVVDNTEFDYLNGVTAPIQTQLNNKQPLDGDLTAIANLATTGFITRTATNTMTTRIITGTASNISVTDGDGISGNPTIDLVNTGTPGTFGSATQVPVITTDAKGRVTSAVNTTITGVPAANITNTPAGNIAATTVQGAINELDTEKAKLAGGNNFTGLQTILEDATTNNNVKLGLKRNLAGDVGFSFEQIGAAAYGIVHRVGNSLDFVRNYYEGNAGSTVARITDAGEFLVGTTTPSTSAKVQIDSTTQGFLPPRMTTAQRLAIVTPSSGLVVQDTTLNNLFYYNGSGWIRLSPFGNEYLYFDDNTASTTTSGAQPLTAVATTTTTPTVPAGVYRIFVQWYWTSNSAVADSRFQLFVDGVAIGRQMNVELADTTTQWFSHVLENVTLTAGTHTIELRFGSELGITTTINRVNGEFWRIS